MKRALFPFELSTCLVTPEYRINFALVGRLRGTLPPDRLADALQRAAVRHPVLAARIELAAPQRPLLVSGDAPPFPVRTLSGCGPDDWAREVEDELALPFPVESGPFARCVLLHHDGHSDLVVVFDHGICDGMSGTFFLRDLLLMLGDPAAALTPPASAPDMYDLFPPGAGRSLNSRLLSALGTPIALIYRLRGHWIMARDRREAGVREKSPGPGQVRGPRSLALSGGRVQLVPGSLSPEETAALVERAHREGTSVYGAVCAAFVQARRVLTPRLPDQGRINCPVNLRDRLAGPVPETAGFYLGTAYIHADCRPARPLWDVARDLKHDLDGLLARGDVFEKRMVARVGVCNTPVADQSAFVAAYAEENIYDYCVSNLGRLDPILGAAGEGGREFELEALWAPVVQAYKAERLLGMSTYRGRLSYTFAVRESQMARPAAEELVRLARQRLLAACA